MNSITGLKRVRNRDIKRIPTINRLPGSHLAQSNDRKDILNNTTKTRIPKIVKPKTNAKYDVKGHPGLSLPKLLTSPELPWPNFNPYNNMPPDFINEYARVRDIYLEGRDSDKANQLWNYERVDSEWIKPILQFNDVNCTELLPTTKYIMYGAINGIDYTHMTRGLNDDAKRYTRLALIMKKLCHKERRNILFINEINIRVIDEYFLHNTELSQDDIGILPDVHKRQMLKTNNLRDLNDLHINGISFDDIRRRYAMLNQYSYPEVLIKLYGSVKDAAKTKPHAIEPLILSINEDNADQIINNIGMLVPRSAENRLRYLLDNIGDYRDVFTRNIKRMRSLKQLERSGTVSKIKYFSKLTDDEILSTTNAYLAYTSRSDLVRKSSGCVQYKGKSKDQNNVIMDKFFTPIIRKKEYALNNETIMGTDINDETTFMVAYGNATSYTLYELDDLYGAFYQDKDDGTFDFRHPEDITKGFNNLAINSLVELLKAYPVNGEIEKLQQRIQQGIARREEMIKEDELLAKQLLNLSKHDRDTLKSLLINMFEMGMYMRRWKGPGNPYPLIEKDTIVKGFDPENGVIDSHISFSEIENNMSADLSHVYNGLLLVRYSKGKVRTSKMRAKPYIDKVFSGKECIRMASIHLVSSGYHYLRVHFGHDIRGFNKQQIQDIY